MGNPDNVFYDMNGISYKLERHEQDGIWYHPETGRAFIRRYDGLFQQRYPRDIDRERNWTCYHCEDGEHYECTGSGCQCDCNHIELRFERLKRQKQLEEDQLLGFFKVLEKMR